MRRATTEGWLQRNPHNMDQTASSRYHPLQLSCKRRGNLEEAIRLTSSLKAVPTINKVKIRLNNPKTWKEMGHQIKTSRLGSSRLTWSLIRTISIRWMGASKIFRISISQVDQLLHLLSIAVPSKWWIRTSKKGQRLQVFNRTIDHRCEAEMLCFNKRRGLHKTRCKIHSMHHQVEVDSQKTPWNLTIRTREPISKKHWIPQTQSKGYLQVKASPKCPRMRTGFRAAPRANSRRIRQSTSRPAATCTMPLRWIINNRIWRTSTMHITRMQTITRERQHPVLWKPHRCQIRMDKMVVQIKMHLNPKSSWSFTRHNQTTWWLAHNLNWQFSRIPKHQTRNSAW